MKKYTLLIIAGVLFLAIGFIFFLSRKENNTYYIEKTNLTQEEATALILEKTKSIIEIYENPKDTFMLDKENEEESEYLTILNYDTIIYNMYTEKGIKELEKTKFDGKLFVVKDEEETFVLKKIPDNNKYKDCSITISDVVVNIDNIKATVSFTKDELGEDDVLTYKVFEKNIELVKNEDKWLINTFVYTNV